MIAASFFSHQPDFVKHVFNELHVILLDLSFSAHPVDSSLCFLHVFLYDTEFAFSLLRHGLALWLKLSSDSQSPHSCLLIWEWQAGTTMPALCSSILITLNYKCFFVVLIYLSLFIIAFHRLALLSIALILWRRLLSNRISCIDIHPYFVSIH